MQAKPEFHLIYGLVSREFLNTADKATTYVISEMRPSLAGVLYTLKQFNKQRLKTILVCDNMLGLLFFKNMIRKATIFYSQKDESGFKGPSGCLNVYILAKYSGVELEFLPSASKIKPFKDKDVSTFLGKRIINYRANIFKLQEDEVKL